MDFFDNLRSRNTRRQFLAFSVLAAILVLFTHVGLTLWLQRAAGQPLSVALALLQASTLLSGGLFAGVVTAAFLLFLSQYLFPSEEALKAVESVDPKRTLELHRKALAETDFWLHSGHIGRWVRVHAISALASTARERGIQTRIVFHILDPDDLDLCNRYSQYRTLIRYQENGFSTVNDTREEVLATVVGACVAMNESPGLNVEVYFRRSINHTRLDICSSLGFQTMIDPRSPAVVYRNLRGRRDHGFYDALKLSLEDELTFARRFQPVGTISRSELNPAAVASFLKDNGFEFPASDGFTGRVVERLLSEYTPYE